MSNRRLDSLFCVVFCFVFLFFASCKKKEIQGPKGEPGTPGGGGNSNITAMEPFLIASSQWLSDTAAGAWKVTVNIPAITKAIVDKGAVRVYQQVGSSWWELPYSEGDFITQYGFSDGTLSLRHTNIEGGMPIKPDAAYYRLVLISESAKPAKSTNNGSVQINSEDAEVRGIKYPGFTTTNTQ